MAERRRTEALLRRVRLRQEALGPSLSTRSLCLSFSFPSAPLAFSLSPARFPCLLPQLLPFRLSSSFLRPFTRSVRVSREAYRNEGHLAFGHRYGTRANGAQALGPSEKRNIVFGRPLFSRNSACTSSIFSPFLAGSLTPPTICLSSSLYVS